MEGAEQGNSEVFSRREYSRPDFWNDRFRESPHAFDWYITWKELRKFLLILAHPEDCPSVLMVGCGSSTLSADMGKVGYDVTILIYRMWRWDRWARGRGRRGADGCGEVCV